MSSASQFPALKFDIIAKCSTTKARVADMILPHGPVSLPMFMPVATQASLKGLTAAQLARTGCKLCLNNTYHLGLKPGQEVLDKIGGAHELQGWDKNILTDSGGFQMVSLLKLAKVTEEGVRFLSPHDGSPMLLTPEHSMSLQNSIGSDIMMQLDDVIATTSPDEARMEEAMKRSVRWLDRCIASHKKPDTQNLFCIIQGGLNLDLRKQCCEEMVKRDTPGIAIGGLSGGEAKDAFCNVVHTCTSLLPERKPRYVMGIGYPEDLLVSVALGADMFDCVWPTRTARFGNALTTRGVLNLRHSSYARDFRVMDEECSCPCCLPDSSKPYPRPTVVKNGEEHATKMTWRMMGADEKDDPAFVLEPRRPEAIESAVLDGEQLGLNITRAYIYHTANKETVGAHLVTMHNVHFLLNMMRQAREAILEDRYPQFLRQWLGKYFGVDIHGPDRWPKWLVDALQKVGVDVLAES